MKRCYWLIPVIGLFATTASAQDPKAQAKEAYRRGLAAHDAGDYRTAAHAFAEADAYLPSPSALSAALDDAVTIDDPILGSELIERAGVRGASVPGLAESVAAAKKKFAGRAAKIRLRCPPAATCNALVDDRKLVTELWVTPGPHTVTTRVDADTQSNAIVVKGDEVVDITPAAAPAQPAAVPTQPATPSPAPTPVEPAPVEHHGLPPAVVYVGGAITLAFVGGMIATGAVAKSQHDDFEQAGCLHSYTSKCVSIHDTGFPLVVMTNVFLGLAIASAAATAVLGIGFTDWHPSVAPTAGGFIGGFQRNF